MATLSASLALGKGNPSVAGVLPDKGPLTRALMFSLMLTNSWINRRVAGDLRQHSGQCDVIVLKSNNRVYEKLR